jgi:hypothetical protein
MIRRFLRRDPLSRRIALTIVAAMLASLALNFLFVEVAGPGRGHRLSAPGCWSRLRRPSR